MRDLTIPEYPSRHAVQLTRLSGQGAEAHLNEAGVPPVTGGFLERASQETSNMTRERSSARMVTALEVREGLRKERLSGCAPQAHE
eukprot:5749272-Amphidinium_carterae.4